jgi:drug/metabolite transporter (DMT)-like permease
MKGFDLTDGPVQAHRLRSWARWAAIIFGILAGIVSLAAGGQSFFVAREGREVIGAVLGMMMLLPLTMIGIFKPRPAAYGMFGSAFVFLAAFIILAPQSDRTTFVGTAEVLLTLVAPGCVVAGLRDCPDLR